MDVVAKLRGILHERRIGHAGTLDPFATGLLIVGVGRESTKRLDEFKSLEKEYEVTLRFGSTSDTYDCEGVVTTHLGAQAITRAELEAVLPKYRGEIMQIPPMYSAKKIGGQKLYDLARQGIEVARAPQPLTIFALEILEFGDEGAGGLGDSDDNTARLRVVCSAGTYIRSLVHDIGQDLGVGAYATALVRTRIGEYKLADAKTIAEIIEMQNKKTP